MWGSHPRSVLVSEDLGSSPTAWLGVVKQATHTVAPGCCDDATR